MTDRLPPARASDATPNFRDGLRCVAIAMAGALLLATTHYWTQDRISANRSAAELRDIAQLLGRKDALVSLAQATWQNDVLELGNDTVRRVPTRGYGGPMVVLIGTNADGVIGVAVSRHTETPGLGDFFELDDGRWLTAAANDYPDVDAVSGATVTSRAIARAIDTALGGSP